MNTKKICENCTRSKHRTLEEKKALIEYDNTLTINDLNKFVEKAGFKSLGIYDEKKKNKTESKRISHFYFFSNSCFIYFHGSYVEISSFKYLNINMHLINYALTLLALTIPFLIYGFDIFKSGFKNLTHKSPNMDTLVSIGVLSSLTYSLVPRRKNLPASENLIRLLTRRFNKY